MRHHLFRWSNKTMALHVPNACPIYCSWPDCSIFRTTMDTFVLSHAINENKLVSVGDNIETHIFILAHLIWHLAMDPIPMVLPYNLAQKNLQTLLSLTQSSINRLHSLEPPVSIQNTNRWRQSTEI